MANDDPTEVLHSAIIDRLKGVDYGLDSLVADRVYDQVAGLPIPTFPYLTVDHPEVLDDSAQCFNGSAVTITVHCWSEKSGTIELQQLVSGVRAALANVDGSDMPLTSHRLLEITFTRSAGIPEPDGVTKHAIVEFAALTEPE